VADYTGDKPVFFASIQYGEPQPFQLTKDSITNKVILLSGIAKPEPLEDYVKSNFELLKHFRFKDHHLYSIKDINIVKNFVEQLNEPVSVLTTEKDMVRLIDAKFNPLLSNINCFYLPIEMKFVKNGADFDKLVIDAVENANTRSNPTGE
jgi:tetraacyldisaccharide 4'-kinase